MLDYPKAKQEIQDLDDLIFEVHLTGEALTEALIDLDEVKEAYRRGDEPTFWLRAAFLRRTIQP